MTADGTPKITDFGLVKRLDDGSALTVSTAVMGTPSYMAPEQAKQAYGTGSHVARRGIAVHSYPDASLTYYYSGGCVTSCVRPGRVKQIPGCNATLPRYHVRTRMEPKFDY